MASNLNVIYINFVLLSVVCTVVASSLDSYYVYGNYSYQV